MSDPQLWRHAKAHQDSRRRRAAARYLAQSKRERRRDLALDIITGVLATVAIFAWVLISGSGGY